jgi:uncharacterized Zn-binding protein involved in type VI secretion
MKFIVTAIHRSEGHCSPTNGTYPIPETCSQTVFIEGAPIVLVGTQYYPHPNDCTTPVPSPHPVTATQGSAVTYVEGRPVVLSDNLLSCGVLAFGPLNRPPTVFSN